MTLTALDPAAALIVVDLQRGMADLAYAAPFAPVVDASATLARAFRAAGRPVVLVNTDGAAPGRREQQPFGGERAPDWTELVPDLGAAPGDHRVTKRTPGAFTGTGLDEWLRGRGVTQVAVCGVTTGTGVETTVRQAYERGYNVAMATDAMTDMDAAVHANSTERTFPRFGETGTAADVIALLNQADG